MKSNEYKRQARLTLSPVKIAKAGIRANINKKSKVNIGHALIGVVSEVGELQDTLSRFLTGATQLTDDLRKDAREELGDVLYYVAIGAKELKLKLPTSTKKVKLHGTITEQVLALNYFSTALSGLYKKQYYGEQIPLDRVTELWENLIQQVWGVCFTLFGEPPATIMEENIAKLHQRYGGSEWNAQGSAHLKAA